MVQAEFQAACLKVIVIKRSSTKDALVDSCTARAYVELEVTPESSPISCNYASRGLVAS